MTNLPSNVHPEAKVHASVVIEPFATVHKNVVIGEGSWIGPYVTIMDGARIGKNCKIFPGAVISSIPQDLKFGGEETTAEIGDNTIIREFVTINRGTVYSNKTVVGKDCLLMAYSHVAHDCLIGDNCILSNGVQLAGHIIIGNYAVVGGTTAVHQFVRIGRHAFVSGGSLVRKDVPPFIKAAREPLSYVGVNDVGLKRRGFTTDNIHHLEDIYRYIFVNHTNISKALEEVATEVPESPLKTEVVEFIRSSERGIVKGLLSNNDDNA
jgi:UDP-N-acetylglucosamine acyltransferase